MITRSNEMPKKAKPYTTVFFVKHVDTDQASQCVRADEERRDVQHHAELTALPQPSSPPTSGPDWNKHPQRSLCSLWVQTSRI